MQSLINVFMINSKKLY